MSTNIRKKMGLRSVVLPTGKTMVLREDAALFRLQKVAALAAWAHKARLARK